MKLGELRKIIADIDTVYDNCDVTCYESNGNLGFVLDWYLHSGYKLFDKKSNLLIKKLDD